MTGVGPVAPRPRPAAGRRNLPAAMNGDATAASEARGVSRNKWAQAPGAELDHNGDAYADIGGGSGQSLTEITGHSVNP